MSRQAIAGFMFALLLALSVAEFWHPEVHALLGANS